MPFVPEGQVQPSPMHTPSLKNKKKKKSNVKTKLNVKSSLLAQYDNDFIQNYILLVCCGNYASLFVVFWVCFFLFKPSPGSFSRLVQECDPVIFCLKFGNYLQFTFEMIKDKKAWQIDWTC